MNIGDNVEYYNILNEKKSGVITEISLVCQKILDQNIRKKFWDDMIFINFPYLHFFSFIVQLIEFSSEIPLLPKISRPGKKHSQKQNF